MRIAPIELFDFSEPVPAAATALTSVPMSFLHAFLGMAVVEHRTRRRPRGSTRIRVSIPEGMRVRIRCA